MSEFHRRDVLRLGALTVLAPLAAKAAPARSTARVRFEGDEVQGGLVRGIVESGERAEVWVDGQPVRVSDGNFCFGFSRDAAKPALVRVRYEGRFEETKEVAVKKRSFRIQRINGLPEKYVSPPKDVLDRIGRDAVAVKEARSHDRDAMWFAEKFDWPAEGPITSIYGSQRILNGEPREPHYGVDIAGGAGSPIRAPAPGVVTLAEDLYLSGNTTVIDHGHGVFTTYLHQSRMDVKVGDELERGQQIGLIGQTGRATGPHLCWRLNWFQTRLDAALLAPPRMGDKA
jgi:murein DD-endopeptidase MepM/ murein hydrolase activator NlpD